jgi:hypothetical protein
MAMTLVRFFQNVNVPPKFIGDPNARIKTSSVYKIWKEIVAILEDPRIGIKVVEFWHPSYLKALGYTCLTSYTFFICEVNFPTSENRISFPSAVVNERLSDATPYLVRVNDKERETIEFNQ